ncbi:hypothetical protein [Syntrophaceticus schinkii]|uniref:Uncharacterized protein n=1 Tax=Syntrophaceticus schinkii TaxID=499207 RepID=A0A0B7MG41_9FIRM|nr:hypothetical protein [Syntrophaceticus schinkii]CEO89040.1 hypothetical protein SSCH_350022 [Syntrophaceticus schinkii]
MKKKFTTQLFLRWWPSTDRCLQLKKTLKISAPSATPELSKLLNLEDKESVILVEQQILSDQGKLIGYGQLFIRGKYCNLIAVSSYQHSQ